jgi:hypothetical protein
MPADTTIGFRAAAIHHSDVALLCRISTTDMLLALNMKVPATDSGFQDVWICKADLDRNSEVREGGSVELLRIRRELALSIAIQLRGRQGLEHAHSVYRDLARRYHPDANNSEAAPMVMRAINELWSAIEATAPMGILTSLPGER